MDTPYHKYLTKTVTTQQMLLRDLTV